MPIPPTPIATMDEDTASIQQDLERCSLTLNVSIETLSTDKEHLKDVAKSVSSLSKAMVSILSENVSKQYMNPCWTLSLPHYETMNKQLPSTNSVTDRKETQLSRKHGKGNRSFICMPYFFIAGFPKSGTTSLHTALRQMPQIVGPTNKEPHWWTRAHLGDTTDLHHHLQQTVLKYFSYFTPASKAIKYNPSVVTYDGSQSILWDSNFFGKRHRDYCAMPVLLSRILPRVKFIVLMRNPVSRLYSMFMYQCSERYGPNVSNWPNIALGKNPADFFHKKVEEAIDGFNKCLEHQSLYECVSEYRFFESKCSGVGAKLIVSIYYIHLKKWLQFYKKEQFLFLKTEDLETRSEVVLSNVTNFLGLNPVSSAVARELLAERVNQNDLKAQGNSSLALSMREDTRKLLEDFYRPYNVQLARLVNDHRLMWN